MESTSPHTSLPASSMQTERQEQQEEASPSSQLLPPPPRHIRNLYLSAMAYNIITLTDGALRAIVLLFLVSLQFSAITLAIMFALYELMGVFMNFYGGILGATFGMRFLLFFSVFGQISCVVMLAPLEIVFPDLSNPTTRNTTLITFYIIVAQMLSGVSKDLMKIQGKSVPKLVTKVGDEDSLFRIISFVTGMKNSIKGFGYLFGSLLLFYVGWVGALCIQGALLFPILPCAWMWMESDLGISEKTRKKGIRWDAFHKGHNVNVLSLARFFLFGSRDVWFEIAAPYFMRSVLQWAPFSVGAFMAGYTIIYGQLQILTQKLFTRVFHRNPTRKDVVFTALFNFLEILVLGIGFYFSYLNFLATSDQTVVTTVLLVGIFIFAALFAVSSAVHSFLIVNYSDHDKISMDVGFYYMSNAGGRMVGTLISGFIYTYTVDEFGISVNLFVSAGFLLLSTLISRYLTSEKRKEAEKKEQQPVEEANQVEEEEEARRMAVV